MQPKSSYKHIYELHIMNKKAKSIIALREKTDKINV